MTKRKEGYDLSSSLLEGTHFQIDQNRNIFIEDFYIYKYTGTRVNKRDAQRFYYEHLKKEKKYPICLRV